MPRLRMRLSMSAARLGMIGMLVVGLVGGAGATQLSLIATSTLAVSGDGLRSDAKAPARVSGLVSGPAGARLPPGQAAESTLHHALRAFDQLLAGRGGPDVQTQSTATPLAAVLDAADLRRAEQEVAQARMMLREAEAEQAHALSDPDALELRAAERELAAVQARFARAEVDLRRLSAPDPVSLEAAERAVQRAEATVQAALAPQPIARTTVAGVSVTDEPALQRARLALQDAIARRDLIRAGPPPLEVDAARRTLSVVEAELSAARGRVDAARRTLSSPSIDEANAAVIAARATLDGAEARLRSFWSASP